MDWTNAVVRGIVAAVIAAFAFAVLWAARRSGKTEQRLQDELAGEKTKSAIVEKSDASAEAAAARSDPSRHDSPARVSGDTVPGWLQGR